MKMFLYRTTIDYRNKIKKKQKCYGGAERHAWVWIIFQIYKIGNMFIIFL